MLRLAVGFDASRRLKRGCLQITSGKGPHLMLRLAVGFGVTKWVQRSCLQITPGMGAQCNAAISCWFWWHKVAGEALLANHPSVGCPM